MRIERMKDHNIGRRLVLFDEHLVTQLRHTCTHVTGLRHKMIGAKSTRTGTYTYTYTDTDMQLVGVYVQYNMQQTTNMY